MSKESGGGRLQKYLINEYGFPMATILFANGNYQKSTVWLATNNGRQRRRRRGVNVPLLSTKYIHLVAT